MNKKFLLIPLTLLTIGANTANYNTNNMNNTNTTNTTPAEAPSNIAYPSFQNNYTNSEYHRNGMTRERHREHPARGYREGGYQDGTRDRRYHREGSEHHYRNREHRRERSEHRRYNNERYGHERYGNERYHGRNRYGNRAEVSIERAIELAYQDLANRGITAVYSKSYGAEFEGGRYAHAIRFRTLEGTGHIKYYIDTRSGEVLNFEHIK